MVHSRDKGGRGERAMVKLLSKWWGSKFFRTPRSGAFATQGFTHVDMNAAGDIMTPDKTFPFSVEVKWQEDWCLDQLLTSEVCKTWKWWEQCVDECPEGMIPLLVFKRNRQPWLYMMWTIDMWCLAGEDSRGRYMTVLAPTPWAWPYNAGPYVVVGLFEDLRKTEVQVWRSLKAKSSGVCRRK